MNDAGLVQEVPQRGALPELLGTNPVEQIVAGDHDQRHARDRPAWQPDKDRQRDHRGADRKDDAGGQPVQIEIEPPAELASA